MRTILVTGGTGYIGSHTCLTLLENKFKVIVFDNLKNSSYLIFLRIKEILIKKNLNKDLINNFTFIEGDIRDIKALENVFSKYEKEGNPIQAVIHFAGLKSVKESIEIPLSYWDVNLLGSINLFKVMTRYECNKIIFSSSATVYTFKNNELLKETDDLNPISPYGNTKLAIERVLKDLYIHSPLKWKICNLRYFNPIGAHSSGLIGENPLGKPNNIFPLILKVASKKMDQLKIFGNDWNTRDGTCIRDFIHVMDVAFGHYLALNYLFDNKSQYVSLNLGTGIGTSILKLIDIFEKVNQVEIPYVFSDRREGDQAFLVADNSLLKKTLNWEPKKNISEMCKDGWNWQKLNPNGCN